jgi:hypothetical protein
MAIPAAQNSVVGSMSDDLLGKAAGINSMMRELGGVFGIAVAVFYVNAHWAFRRWSDLFTVEFDRRLMQRLSYVGALMALVGAWIAFPEEWTAVAWGVACASCVGAGVAWAVLFTGAAASALALSTAALAASATSLGIC